MDEQGPYDDLVSRLTVLRVDAGSPSFGDIATGVSRVRRDRGLTSEQARVGRTTVYDAFRLGRQRIDADLIGDIARALGADGDLAESMSAEARQARSGTRTASSRELVEDQERDDVDVAIMTTTGRTGPPRRVVLAVLVGCLGVNLVGRVVVDALGLPIYLDMVGTAFAAITLGPWWGALVGATTNVAGVPLSGAVSLIFTPVNIAGALLWGYGARRGWARTVPRFFVLNIVVAVVCSCIAVPTIVVLERGFGGHGTDAITLSAMALFSSIWASVTVSNLLTSIVDKLICGFVSLAALESLPSSLRPADWMTGAPPPGSEQVAVRGCSGSEQPVPMT